jgi:hypothetical protein
LRFFSDLSHLNSRASSLKSFELSAAMLERSPESPVRKSSNTEGHISPSVNRGACQGRSLKEASEFEEQGASFDEIVLITKDKFAGDHRPMNFEMARSSGVS